MLNNPLGIGPVRLLFERFSPNNVVRFPSVIGSPPLKLFMFRSKYFNSVRFPMVHGIDPLILFPATVSPPKFLSLPKEEGRVPVKELCMRTRRCRLTRLPIPSGMLPLIPLDLSSRCISEVERLEMERGRAPSSLFSFSPKTSSWEQFVNAAMNSQSLGPLAWNKLFEICNQ